MDKYVHLILLSSVWEGYHRKVFTETLYDKFNSWSDFVLIQFPISLTVNLFVKFKKKLLGYFTGNYAFKEIKSGMYLFTPVILFHLKLWDKIRQLKLIDIYLLTKQINKCSSKFADKKIILWVYLPEHFLLLKKIKYDYLIYDFYDNNVFTSDGKPKKNYKFYNDELIKKSNLVICTAGKLFEVARNLNVNSLHIPNANNAGDPIFFKKNDFKTELSDFKEPIIGYVGNIRDWIDFELIEKLLINFKNAKIVLVGPVDKTAVKYIKKISKYENLILTGEKQLELIPKYIEEFKVGIIPFKLNKFTEGVMPIKFFEYLSAGIPMVTTNLPDFKFYEKIIGYSQNHSEFIKNCEEALNGSYEGKIIEYKKIALENTWEKRVEIIESFLKDNLIMH